MTQTCDLKALAEAPKATFVIVAGPEIHRTVVERSEHKAIAFRLATSAAVAGHSNPKVYRCIALGQWREVIS